jgi:uncharacterized membrane protein
MLVRFPEVNPILLYFASGESLYSGAALLLVTVAISPHLTHRRPLRLRNIVTWLALAMIVMACPPFSWIIDAMFGVVFFLWFVAWNKTPERSWVGISSCHDGSPARGVASACSDGTSSP